MEQSIISPDLRLMIAVGFLTTYTTFFTYTLDIEKLLMVGYWQFSILYWTGSSLLGVLGVELGVYVVRRVL